MFGVFFFFFCFFGCVVGGGGGGVGWGGSFLFYVESLKCLLRSLVFLFPSFAISDFEHVHHGGGEGGLFFN